MVEPKLCECGCGLPAPLATKTYSSRGIKKGEPFRFYNGHQRRLPFAWDEEDRGYKTPCHIWRWRLDPKGYGIAARQNDGRQPRAHRLAWERENGPIPEGLYVLHRCDVPSCVNVEHLFLGTQQDNMDDMYEKGRGRKAKGGKHPNAQLTSGQVEAIRRVEGLSLNEIAALAGTSESTVSKIRRGVTRANG